MNLTVELETAEPASIHPPAQDTVSILLVDDEPRNLDVLESILESADRQLVRAHSAEETLLALVRGDFAAIVLDIQMPDMSGFELAKLIKQRKRNRHIPIIFLTAYFQEDKDVLSGYDIGAVDYLTKPVDPHILKSKVNVFVDLFRSNRALAAANLWLEQEITERRQAQLALARLAAIVETSSDAILSRTLDGVITSWNRGAERIFGYTAAEIVGQPIARLLPSERADELEHFTADLEQGKAVESFETVRVRKDGCRIDVSITISAIKDGTGAISGYSSIVRDISEQKRAHQALQASEAKLQAIMDHSPAMIFLKDTQGRYLHFNRQFGKHLRLRLETTVGKTDAEIFAPDRAAVLRANDLAVLETGQSVVFEEITGEGDSLRKNIITKFPLLGPDAEIYAIGGIVTDVTEQRRLEAEVLQISEREQRRIAEDLHDGLGQQLAGIACLSNLLKRNLAEQGSPEAATATRISKLLDASVAQTRTLARGLYPVAPEPSGLMAALENLAASITDLFQTACRFECPRLVLFPDAAAATHLYRIAQEAVTNALKHGQAKHIKVGLFSTLQRIVLLVDDDGVGFAKAAKSRPGLGLRIMSYRAGIIGGTLAVRERPGGGTEVVCTVEKTETQAPPHAGAHTHAETIDTQEDPDR